MDVPESELRYLRHLYVSLGKIVTSSTKEKPTALLVEEFNYYTETRRPLLIEWLDQQVTFTRNRNKEMIRKNKNSQIPTDIRVLVGAWEFLKSVVIHSFYPILRQMWNLFGLFGVKEDEHNQYSWHLGAILYHWINEGIKEGLIPDNPFRTPFTHKWQSNDDATDEEHAMEDVCLHLRALQCFLNFTVHDGEALLQQTMESFSQKGIPCEAVYLFRLSATVPGMIVLQFVVSSLFRESSTNLRLDQGSLGKDYHFFMSPVDYATKCEDYIRKVSGLRKMTNMIQIQPTLKEMIGLTKSYTVYFETDTQRSKDENIPLLSVYTM